MAEGGRLTLTFWDDDDGTGKLSASASANGFSGESAAWFGVKELQEFAARIGAFPLPQGERPEISSGYGHLDEAGNFVMDEEHVALKVYALDQLGHFGVQVRLASEIWDAGRPETRHTVQLEIFTAYGGLAAFSKALRALLAGKVEEAVLQGD
jgi:hypothetical protein